MLGLRKAGAGYVARAVRLLTPPGVFAPISDSRFLADVLREQTLPPRATVLDLCTGSGILLLVSSSVLGTDLTLQAMKDAGLEDVDVVARQRGPLGPLMSARVHTLEERGMLKPGQRHEDVIIVRGRQPEREGW